MASPSLFPCILFGNEQALIQKSMSFLVTKTLPTHLQGLIESCCLTIVFYDLVTCFPFVDYGLVVFYQEYKFYCPPRG